MIPFFQREIYHILKDTTQQPKMQSYTELDNRLVAMEEQMNRQDEVIKNLLIQLEQSGLSGFESIERRDMNVKQREHDIMQLLQALNDEEEQSKKAIEEDPEDPVNKIKTLPLEEREKYAQENGIDFWDWVNTKR